MLQFIKQRPVTLGLILVNVLVFIAVYAEVGSLEEPAFSMYLLDTGALFAAFTLDSEGYRLVSHMFLHGFVLHLVLNMYALFTTGSELEPRLGSLKLLLVYLICGIAGGIASMYLSLFTVSVGASGAIFGIFGFALVVNIVDTLSSGRSMTILIVNFVIFLLLYFFISSSWHVDHAGHIGGLLCGVSIALLDHLGRADYKSLIFPAVYVVILVVLFAILPRDQVHYYKFFERVLKAEDNGKELFSRRGMSDNDFRQSLSRNRQVWDSAGMALDSLDYVRPELQPDTFKLRRYISLRARAGEYRIRMITEEKYILMDSIEVAEDSIRNYLQIAYVPPIRREKAVVADNSEPQQEEQTPRLVQVWYDSNWIETPYRGPYYRLGIRDSTGEWNGAVRDHYASGKVQMKGVYNKDQRDGIFLYYSEQNKYESAGRYIENRRVGKWQTFYKNGRLASEVYYDRGYFIANTWDSAGTQHVINGNGTLREYYSNGVVKEEGLILNGRRNGTWTGRFADGTIHYQEDYNNGTLIRGRSRDEKGHTFIYDQGVYFPKPEGGYDALKQTLDAAAQQLNRPQTGTIRVGFRVTSESKLTDFEFEKDVTPEIKKIVRGLILNGPAWTPAREFGYKPADGFAELKIEF